MKALDRTKLTADRDLFDVPAVAQRLGSGQSTIWAEIAAGRLRAVKHGRRTKITRADLDDYLASLPPARSQDAA